MRRIHHRRRAVAGATALVLVILVVLAVPAVDGWFSGGSSEASTSPVTTQDADTPQAEAVPCPADPSERFGVPADEPPAELTVTVGSALTHRSLTIRPAGASIWVDGYGVVGELEPAVPLTPASNQKILTAMGVLELLDHQSVLTTEIRSAATIDDAGVLNGDLHVIGGGDPLIKRAGDHSLEDIANRLADLGLTQVTGDVTADESRYDQVRKAPGWLDWEMPLPGGSMSALMVNSNSRIGGDEYLANPTQHNVDLIVDELETAGIDVVGVGRPGPPAEGAELVLGYDSPPVADMVGVMLGESDNMTAEMLTKEVGLQVAGEPSTQAGLAAMVEALEDTLCISIDGINDDASGISRENRRSPQSWRELLQAARDATWFDVFYDALPEAGKEGTTLVSRFLGSEADGDVNAKTGSLGTSVALSGYVETDGGRLGVFSIVANGDQPDPAVPAMDAVIISVAADDS
jgi:D-alanyl-D-alanine carboxypeptidase/D-alanyl-D-alanine-endopeptidase (penicillin-binding protein 4)